MPEPGMERAISAMVHAVPDLDARTIAEALWLAAGRESEVPTAEPAASDPPVRPRNAASQQRPSEPPPPVSAPGDQGRSVPVSERIKAAGRSMPGVPLLVARNNALPDALALGRALRPLRRPWPRGRRNRLDTEATAEHYAHTGRLIPVFTPAPERWFDVVLVVDRSLSMAVWKPTTDALLSLLRDIGVFRGVRVCELDWERSEPYLVDHRRRRLPLRQSHELGGSPADRRLVLVVSDCASPGWYEPEIWRQLRETALKAPTALIDPLPPQLWRRTALTLPAVRVTTTVVAARNPELAYRLPLTVRAEGADQADWLPLPVLSLTPLALRRWARTLMRTDPRGCDAVLLPENGRPTPPVENEPEGHSPLPAELTARAFLHTAPAPATRLAVLSSQFTNITLGLLHLLRDYLVPDARTSDLAELLLGGIFVRSSTGTDELTFGFREHVSEVLREHLTVHDVRRTQQALTRHIATHPHAPQGIAAIAHTPEAREYLPAELHPFARAASDSARVLRNAVKARRPVTTPKAVPGSSPPPPTGPVRPSLPGRDVGRVVVLSRRSAGRTVQLGCGYLVSDGVLLTAAHVVEGFAHVEARHESEPHRRWYAQAELFWANAEADIALLRIKAAPDGPARPVPRVDPVRFGALPRRRSACRVFSALWSAGSENEEPLSPAIDAVLRTPGAREDRTTIEIDDDPRLPATAVQLWTRLSGAAVFEGERLIGLVDYAHPDREGWSLGATWVESWYERLSDRDLAVLNSLTDLPQDAQQLHGIFRLSTAAPPPRQLPPAPSLFIDRTAAMVKISEVARAFVDGRKLPATVVIDGMPGVGKTALAIQAAHRIAPAFPDGCLWANLQGSATDRPPRKPRDVLVELLKAMMVPADVLPESTEQLALLYQRSLVGRQMVIVLDDAADAEQLRPLIPNRGGCLVITTSRRKMKELDNVSHLRCDPMPQADAREMFTAIAGREIESDAAEQVDELLETCGGLPLVISIVASNVRHGLLSGSGDLEPNPYRVVGEAIAASYRRLNGDAAHMFRETSLFPGADFDVYAAANLAGISLRAAREDLEVLEDNNLLTEARRARYAFHDLVRGFARSVASTESADASMERLLAYYLYTAFQCDRFSAQFSQPFHTHASALLPEPTAPRRFALLEEAQQWVHEEIANLITVAEYALAHELPQYAVALSGALSWCLRTRGLLQQAEALHSMSLAGARRAGDELAEADTLREMGMLQISVGDFTRAEELLRRALELFSAHDHRIGQANVLSSIGEMNGLVGDYRTAVDAHQRALALYAGVGDRFGEARVLDGLAEVYRRTGDYRRALDTAGRSLRAFRTLHDRSGEADALDSLGQACLMAADHAGAAHYAEQALGLYRNLGDPTGEAYALDTLGRARRLMGDIEGAVRSAEESLTLFEKLGDRSGQAYALDSRSRALVEAGQPRQAVAAAQTALGIFRDIGDRAGEASTLDSLSRAHLGLREARPAERYRDDARQLRLQSISPSPSEEPRNDYRP